jgi:phospholipid/cholesterol/gamma-HCH transport system substrate-binding protein
MVSYIEEGGEIARVERQADIDKLLRELGLIAEDVKAVTASLRAVAGGEEGEASLRAIVNNTRELSENLNNVVKRNEDRLGIMISNLTSASKEMEKTFVALSDVTERIKRGEGSVGKLIKDDRVFDNLNETVASLKDIMEKINRGEGTVGKLVNEERVVDNLNETLVSMKDISDKINKGEGTIGKLVNDEETVNNLNAGLKSIDESMKGINRYVSKSEQFRTFLSYRGEYLFDKSDAKSYLDLKFQPKWDKFYILGVVTDPRGKRTVTDRTTDGKTTRTEEWEKDELLFNVEIGKRFKDVVLRGGLLESTGGIGLDYFALNDDLKFTCEAFDFDADRDPHLKVFAEYELLKHVYLSAGWDDFLSNEGNESPFIGFSIRFEDDDLKYLLTSAPLPK